MKPWLTLTLVVVILMGCASAPVTDPAQGQLTVVATAKPDGSVTKTMTGTLKGEQNSKEGITASVGADGSATFTTSGSEIPKAASWTALQPLSIIGAIVFIAGLAALAMSYYPIIGVTIPAKVGYVIMAGGLVLAFAPILSGPIQIIVVVAGIAGVAYLVFTLAKKEGLIHAAVVERTAKGDADGAGVAAFLASGGDKTEAEWAKQQAATVAAGKAAATKATP